MAAGTTVPLGSQGLQTSVMGLGCMGMSAGYTKPGEAIPESQIKEVFDRAAELGVTMLNTCEFYGSERANERLIARTTGHLPPSTFQISLKLGGVGSVDTEIGLKMDSSPVRLKAALDESLAILGRESIDLVVQARQDPNVPLAEVMQCFKELVEAGKVKYVGLSEVSPALIREAHAIHPLTCVEQEWSLWSRDLEEGIVPTCRELGIGILAYSPLGRGFLTGGMTEESMKELAPTDFRVVGMPRLHGDNLKKNLQLVEVVKAFASRKNCTPGQVALAWLYAQAKALGVSMVPIPGTKRVKYLEQNVAALQVEISEEERAELCGAFPLDAAAGDRYAHKFLMFQKD